MPSGLAARGASEEPAEAQGTKTAAAFEELTSVSAEPCPCRGGAEPAEGGSAAGGAPGATGFAADDYRILASGTNADVRQELVARAETAAGLAALWDRVARTRVPRPDPPEVDFETEVAIAVFSGERPSGGYGVEIDGLCRRSGDAGRGSAGRGDTGGGSPLHLCYTELEPPDDAILTMALTSPYLIIAVERPVGEVVIHRRTATR